MTPEALAYVKRIFFHSQILLAGICAYSALYHFFVVSERAQRRVNQLFAIVSLLMALYTFSNVQCFEQTTLNDFIPNLRLTFVFYILFVGIFPWFITKYSEVRPMPVLVTISAIITLMFVVNLIEPFTILYSHINEYKHVTLPNGEGFYSVRGTAGTWFYLWVATVFFVYLFGICTLIGYYRRKRRSSILVMIFAVGMLLAFSVAGTLFRMGIIHIPPLVPFGFLGVVIIMSLALNYERQQDRKRAEEILREREYELEEAHLLAGTGSWTYDPVIQKSTWSKGMFHIWGLDPALGLFPVEDHQKFIHPDDYQQFAAILKEAVDHGVPYTMELRINRPDGEQRTVITICEPICDEKGSVVKLRGTNQDITERKKVEELLHITRFSIDHSSDGLFWMTPDARIVDVNEAACRSLGYSREELLQLSIPDIDPLYNFNAWQHFYVELQQKGTRTFETEHLTKDGKRFPVEIVANLIQFDSKELTCAFVRNITDRKKSEKALLRYQVMLDRTESITHAGSWEWDVATGAVTWSQELFRIHQLKPADGAPSLEEQSKLYHPKDMAELKRVVGVALSEGTPYELELRAIRQDGETRFCVATGFAERDSEGNIINLFGSLQDITERKKAEEALSINEARLRFALDCRAPW